MPKILRIINRFNLGGPAYNVAYLTKYLAPEFETLLIGGVKDETEESSEFIFKNLGLEYIIIPEMKRSINPFHDLAAYNKIKKIIRDFKPDIVHTHAAKAGALGRRAAYACKVPIIVHTFHGHVFHSYFGGFKTSLFKAIERKLSKKTSAIITISHGQKKELVNIHKICEAEKIHVIPLGFDLQRFHEHPEEKRKNFREKFELSDEDIAVGIIGRLVPVKNHLLFLDAVKFIKNNSRKKIKAFIIGDGEERSTLEKKSKEFGLDQIVVFSSWEKEVEKIYPGLDIVCLTSHNEGTPVSLIEAQAANRAIVSTNIGGIENTVKPGITALLSPTDELKSFCSNLLLLVENNELRKKMQEDGWDHVREKFHFSRLVKDTSLLYNSLLGSHTK